jgi:hypothetical protein
MVFFMVSSFNQASHTVQSALSPRHLPEDRRAKSKILAAGIMAGKILVEKLLDRVPFRFHACGKGAIVGVAFLRVFIGLLLFPLLPGFLILPHLTGLPRASKHAANYGACRSPFAARIVPFDDGTYSRTHGSTLQGAAPACLLLRRRGGSRGRLHRVKAGLLFGPLVTGELVLFHLVLTLPLGRKDDGVLSQGNPSEKERYEHRKGTKWYSLHDCFPPIMFVFMLGSRTHLDSGPFDKLWVPSLSRDFRRNDDTAGLSCRSQNRHESPRVIPC